MSINGNGTRPCGNTFRTAREILDAEVAASREKLDSMDETGIPEQLGRIRGLRDEGKRKPYRKIIGRKGQKMGDILQEWGILSTDIYFAREIEGVYTAKGPGFQVTEYAERGDDRESAGGSDGGSLGGNERPRSDDIRAQDQGGAAASSVEGISPIVRMALWGHTSRQKSAGELFCELQELLGALAGTGGERQVLERVLPAGDGSSRRSEGEEPAVRDVPEADQPRSILRRDQKRVSELHKSVSFCDEPPSSLGVLGGHGQRAGSPKRHNASDEEIDDSCETTSREPATQLVSDLESTMEQEGNSGRVSPKPERDDARNATSLVELQLGGVEAGWVDFSDSVLHGDRPSCSSLQHVINLAITRPTRYIEGEPECPSIDTVYKNQEGQYCWASSIAKAWCRRLLRYRQCAMQTRYDRIQWGGNAGQNPLLSVLQPVTYNDWCQCHYCKQAKLFKSKDTILQQRVGQPEDPEGYDIWSDEEEEESKCFTKRTKAGEVKDETPTFYRGMWCRFLGRNFQCDGKCWDQFRTGQSGAATFHSCLGSGVRRGQHPRGGYPESGSRWVYIPDFSPKQPLDGADFRMRGGRWIQRCWKRGCGDCEWCLEGDSAIAPRLGPATPTSLEEENSDAIEHVEPSKRSHA